MSDMTSDMIEMDRSEAPAASRENARRKNGVEFTVYFAIIFLATLPLAPKSHRITTLLPSVLLLHISRKINL